MKFSYNRCVCNTVIIFNYNGIPLKCFCFLLSSMGKVGLTNLSVINVEIRSKSIISIYGIAEIFRGLQVS